MLNRRDPEMPPPPSTSGSRGLKADRKTDRQDAVVQALRDSIIEGQMAPGSRLPNRIDIETSYGASSITVQKALERLKEEGFVIASRRNGTFVSQRPPHLNHYALVFPSRPGAPMWNRFWDALCKEASKLEATSDLHLPIFYDVDGHEDSEDYQRLMRAVLHKRFAGVIFANTPDAMRHSPLFADNGLPSVAIANQTKIPNLPVLYPSPESFQDRALDLLAERGCRRIAVFQPGSNFVCFENALRERGFLTHPYWVQTISLWEPANARRVAHMMMNPNQLERPDGVIISDDNLLPSVTRGMVDAGIRPHRDVQIVAHTNFPWPADSALPVTRLGFDTTQVLEASIRMVDDQRRGAQCHPVIRLAAVTEPESMAAAMNKTSTNAPGR